MEHFCTHKKERKKEKERERISKEGKLFVQKLIILILMGVLAGLLTQENFVSG
jgi:hypothetical protein